MVAKKVILTANHSKIQQLHVEFCYLIKVFWILWIIAKRGWQIEEDIKKIKLGTTLRITLIFE
jgi:hypothetical protein